MSLKSHPGRAPAAAAPGLAWGVLASPGEPVSTIRFECPDGAYTYPYHTLSRWILRLGPRETLEIQAGTDRIQLEGRHLAVIRDALDAGRLRSIRLTPERYASAKPGVCVFSLRITSE